MKDWTDTYPRSQMKRKSFFSLDGEWECNGIRIVVPYPPQSKLSQFFGTVKKRLTYRRNFTLPFEITENKRIYLHFGAVDQVAKVYVNNSFVGMHKGGYLPFHLDITEEVKPGENTLRVEVKDDLNPDYPYGKQSKSPKGMWYTPVSGIWQSVWLEEVCEDGITGLKIDTTCTTMQCKIRSRANRFRLRIYKNGNQIYEEVGSLKTFFVDFEKLGLPIYLWTPEQPNLYDFTIETKNDKVESYFALRQIEIGEVNGKKRVLLNHKPIFLHGVLDQGYFEDGIFLPKSKLAYELDILSMKKLGFNTLRKHIKVEPDAFYEACDRLGMLVLQDMVNSGDYSFVRDTLMPNIGWGHKLDHVPGHRKRKYLFMKHCVDTCEVLHNHPSIIAFTIFNEGWGQFDADKMYDLIKKLEPSRLIDATSGWFHQKNSDFDSRHVYFRNKLLKGKDKPVLLSECGGYTQAVEGHLFKQDVHYGYGNVDSNQDVTDRICEMYEKMVLPSIPYGLCGCIYTQLSDVETEINGLVTYDREVCKVQTEKMLELAKKIENAFF